MTMNSSYNHYQSQEYETRFCKTSSVPSKEPESMYKIFNYEQQQTAPAQSSQPSLSWNGNEWVTSLSSGTAGSSQYSNYTHQQQHLQCESSNADVKASDQPSRYWYDQGQKFRTEASQHGITETEKAELLRKASWSDYYYGQAYYSQQQQTKIAESSCPSKNTPPLLSTGGSGTVCLNPLQEKKELEEKKEGKDEYPESLRRYVKRSLEGCENDLERQKVQEVIEKRIGEALRDASMWTTKWDNLTAKTLPGSSFVSNCSQGASNSFSNVYAEKKQAPQSFITKSSLSSSPFSPSSVQQSSLVLQSCASTTSSSSFSKSSPFAYQSSCSSSVSEKKRRWGKSATNAGNDIGHETKHNQKNYASSLPMNDSYYGASGDTNLGTPDKKNKKQKKHYFGEKSADDILTLKHTGFNVSASTLVTRTNRFGCSSSESSSHQPESKQSMGQYMGTGVINGGRSSNKVLDEIDFAKMTVKGICHNLEKQYLRLTAPPKANMVRPRRILSEHLINLKTRWSARECEYVWLCSQLKAVRQDLTVQRINDYLTVDVYETHARIALEEADLNEYNQCQTQLKDLYRLIENEVDSKNKTTGLRNVVSYLFALIQFVQDIFCQLIEF
mmetsp:Transcript_42444/g.50933  ORF Transcript_42444/g.50933 Transcript_42444/m.50933 type:complete len:614 (+) Transcript_42444:103-1944(+)